MPEKMDHNIPLKEAAEILGVKVSTLYKAVSAKEGLACDLPYMKLGRRTFYRRSDIEAWMERHLVNPGQEAAQDAPKAARKPAPARA